jgi:hypothetical protein
MLQADGMEMVGVLVQTNVVVKEETKTDVEKSKIKRRNSGSIKQSYFGVFYTGRAVWNWEKIVPPTAAQ